MNRSIKFIAWHRFGKKWLDKRVFSVGLDDGKIHNMNCVGSIGGCDLYQFTGLLDKDGKEIYEGHKLAVSSETMDMIGGSLTEVVVGFENGSYMVGRNNVNHLNTYLWLLTTWNSSDCKIIGHIAEEG